MSPNIPFCTPEYFLDQQKDEKSNAANAEARLTDAANARATNDPTIVDFDGPQDPSIAINWKPREKWVLIFVLSSMTFITALASAMFAPGVPQLMGEFGSKNTVLASLVVSIYILGNAFGPILLAPLSELYGRSPIYHVTNISFVIFTVACALSSSLNMLIVFRFLQGTAGSAAIALGGGTVADLFIQEERGKAIALWAMCPLLGPVVGPIGGGFLSASLGWRWVFWVLAIAASVVMVSYFIFVPETYSLVILQRKTVRLRKELNNPHLKSRMDSGLSLKVAFRQAIIRPLNMLLFSPIVGSLATLSAVVYGYLYLVFTTITDVFESNYGFSPNIVGLTFIGVGLGMMAGVAAFGGLSDRILVSKARANGGEMKPEYRLSIMIPGGLCTPIGFFIYGWTAEKHVFWLAPILGTSLIGAGVMAYFIPIQSYLLDAFTVHAASALAANAIWRSIVGALIPLAGLPMYNALGLGWGNSLLGFVSVILIPVPMAISVYGERIRKSARFNIEGVNP
ncbi:hypothetical protein IMSHALPRED_011047 [Imshaugia aleurites]|uniref:Major facilitator superfamily (MFS) profile domain-containing protein n=1 Tax=Imshaugia aleurites TaxID=172621 RepID=A0A8H3J068_9LECA|nr:hypothetical protein IMSHALPRED_011047 [Imshaugia aleurites]